jgi:hypothetical protein
LMEMVRCEAGDLPDGQATQLQSHAFACARCGGLSSLIECARSSLLGATPHDRCVSAHNAAVLLVALVERRRLSRS